MDEKVEEKVVIKMNSGEVVKGFMSDSDLKSFVESGCGKCRLRGEGNTTAVYVSPSQIKGLFTVLDFDGRKPAPTESALYRVRAVLNGNSALIISSSIVALLSMAGLLFIL